MSKQKVIAVYAKTVRFCGFLEKYYALSGFSVKPSMHLGEVRRRFFGVHTLQEFRQFVNECNENMEKGVTTIAILGSLPAGVTLDLPFVDAVFAFDSENDPKVDTRYLQYAFGVGRNTVDFARVDDA